MESFWEKHRLFQNISLCSNNIGFLLLMFVDNIERFLGNCLFDVIKRVIKIKEERKISDPEVTNGYHVQNGVNGNCIENDELSGHYLSPIPVNGQLEHLQA